MEDMQKRIERGHIQQEKRDAIKVSLASLPLHMSHQQMYRVLAHVDYFHLQAMCDIASDRAKKLGA